MSVFTWLVPARPLGRIDYLKRVLVFTVLTMIMGVTLVVLSGGEENSGYEALVWLLIIPMAINLWWRIRSCFVSKAAVWIWFLLAFFLPFVGIIFLFWPPIEDYETEAADGSSGRIVMVIVGIFVAIALIGVLAAIALPAYQAYVDRAKVAQLSMSADSAKAAVAEYAASQYTWPEDENDLGQLSMGAGVSTEVTEGVVTVYFTASPEKRLRFDPYMENGQLTWSCQSVGYDASVLPASCR